MLQDFMWTTFEKTGYIDAYLSYKELEGTSQKENQIEQCTTETRDQ